MRHMSEMIFELQKLKMKVYYDITKLGSAQVLDSFIKLINNYKIIYEVVHKKYNHFRRLECLH